MSAPPTTPSSSAWKKVGAYTRSSNYNYVRSTDFAAAGTSFSNQTIGTNPTVVHITGDIDMSGGDMGAINRIINVKDPVNPQDVATKHYVDFRTGGLGSSIGITGEQGPPGPKGDPGFGGPGPTGPTGVYGPTGYTGPAGATGRDGTSVNTGPAGPVGPAGPIGPLGPTGTQGVQGVQGIQGLQGYQGAGGLVVWLNPQGTNYGDETINDSFTMNILPNNFGRYKTGLYTVSATYGNSEKTIPATLFWNEVTTISPSQSLPAGTWTLNVYASAQNVIDVNQAGIRAAIYVIRGTNNEPMPNSLIVESSGNYADATYFPPRPQYLPSNIMLVGISDTITAASTSGVIASTSVQRYAIPINVDFVNLKPYAGETVYLQLQIYLVNTLVNSTAANVYLYFQTDYNTTTTYSYLQTTFSNFGSQGVKGDTGPVGATGSNGATGPAGVTGTGFTGSVGATGAVGSTGQVGATGPTGMPGQSFAAGGAVGAGYVQYAGAYGDFSGNAAFSYNSSIGTLSVADISAATLHTPLLFNPTATSGISAARTFIASGSNTDGIIAAGVDAAAAAPTAQSAIATGYKFIFDSYNHLKLKPYAASTNAVKTLLNCDPSGNLAVNTAVVGTPLAAGYATVYVASSGPAAGNVGVCTTTPAAAHALDVSGTQRITTAGSNGLDGGLYLGSCGDLSFNNYYSTLTLDASRNRCVIGPNYVTLGAAVPTNTKVVTNGAVTCLSGNVVLYDDYIVSAPKVSTPAVGLGTMPVTLFQYDLSYSYISPVLSKAIPAFTPAYKSVVYQVIAGLFSSGATVGAIAHLYDTSGTLVAKSDPVTAVPATPPVSTAGYVKFVFASLPIVYSTKAYYVQLITTSQATPQLGFQYVAAAGDVPASVCTGVSYTENWTISFTNSKHLCVMNNSGDPTNYMGVNTVAPAAVLDVSGTSKFRGAMDLSANFITNVAAPVQAADAANKTYVDAYAVPSVAYTWAAASSASGGGIVYATSSVSSTAVSTKPTLPLTGWTTVSLSTTLNTTVNSLHFHNGLWLATGVGTTDTLAYSLTTPPATWTGLGKTLFTTAGINAAYAGGYWLLLGQGGTYTVYYSANPLPQGAAAFTAVTSGTPVTAANAAAYNGSSYVVGGSGTNTLSVCSNAVPASAWTGLGATLFSSACYTVAANSAYWVAGGTGTNTLVYSAVSVPSSTGNWTSIPGVFSVACYSVENNGGGSAWVAIGADAGNAVLAYSTTTPPTTWTVITQANFPLTIAAAAGTRVRYVNGTWIVSSGNATNQVAYSTTTPPAQGTWTVVTQTLTSAATYGFAAAYYTGTGGVTYATAGSYGVADTSYNTHWGAFSGTNGSRNTALGYQAMAANGAAATDNVVIGVQTGRGMNGTTSIAVGNNALSGTAAGTAAFTGSSVVAVGNSALSQATTAANTVAIGGVAGGSLTTGSNSIYVGYGTTASTAAAVNETVLGYNQTGKGNNTVTLGNSSTVTLYAQVTTITGLSDVRDKQNVRDVGLGRDFVRRLRPVDFEWNMRKLFDRDAARNPEAVDAAEEDARLDRLEQQAEYEAYGGTFTARDGRRKIGQGFLAQDLIELEDELGIRVPGLTARANPERYAVSYGALIPILVKAIQQQDHDIQQLKQALQLQQP